MFKIFFSWQSDTPQICNTKAMRQAIAQSAPSILVKLDEKIIPDEATRDVAGAPYIPGKLAEKIQQCQMFIADVTSVAVLKDGKSLPNPNVTFELGLAVAHLGWDRVILLFNEEIAELKGLPFDFDRHRISKYKMAENKAAVAQGQKSLNSLVERSIAAIIEKNPKLPKDLEGKSEKEIKHGRDVMNLEWFFRHMSIDLLGQHTREMPQMLHYFAPYMVDGLDGVVNSPSFKLYNDKLERQLKALVRDLRNTLAFDHLYRDLNSTWVQAFGTKGKHSDYDAERIAADKIRKLSSSLAKRLEKIVQVIRNEYLEVDLDSLSNQFAKEYTDMKNRV